MATELHLRPHEDEQASLRGVQLQMSSDSQQHKLHRFTSAGALQLTKADVVAHKTTQLQLADPQPTPIWLALPGSVLCLHVFG